MVAAGKFIQSFLTKFNRDETTTLAASLAFYTALSLAPLVILFVTISSQFSLELQNSFVSEAGLVVGHEGAEAFNMVIESAKTRPDLTSIAGVVGIITLLFSSSLIFGELRSALNRIFEVAPDNRRKSGYARVAWAVLHQHILHVGVALCFIMILIFSLAASSIINSAESGPKSMMAMLNILLSLVSYFLLFTLTFRYLPDRRQPWRRALRGGALTALLFVLGKELISLYLGNSAIGSAYGAAGSVIVLLVWVYYSTLITFIGAQVSAILIPPHKRKPA